MSDDDLHFDDDGFLSLESFSDETDASTSAGVDGALAADREELDGDFDEAWLAGPLDAALDPDATYTVPVDDGGWLPGSDDDGAPIDGAGVGGGPFDLSAYDDEPGVDADDEDDDAPAGGDPEDLALDGDGGLGGGLVDAAGDHVEIDDPVDAAPGVTDDATDDPSDDLSDDLSDDALTDADGLGWDDPVDLSSPFDTGADGALDPAPDDPVDLSDLEF